MAAKTIFTPAPEVEEIAEALILRFHKHLHDNDVRIVYLFRDKTPERGGMQVWGEAKKITGLNAYLAAMPGEEARDFFCILISEPIWARMGKKERWALVDHELSHCYAARRMA